MIDLATNRVAAEMADDGSQAAANQYVVNRRSAEAITDAIGTSVGFIPRVGGPLGVGFSLAQPGLTDSIAGTPPPSPPGQYFAEKDPVLPYQNHMYHTLVTLQAQGGPGSSPAEDTAALFDDAGKIKPPPPRDSSGANAVWREQASIQLRRAGMDPHSLSEGIRNGYSTIQPDVTLTLE